MSAQRSIVIGGGAFAGLALALALRQGLGADIPIIVADPALELRPSRDPRATAIVAACRRLFDAIGVWDQVAGQARLAGRACGWRPTAHAKNGASVRGSPPMVGITINPASWSPSATSAIITAAPKNIFCPPVRSRSCR